MMEVKLVQIDSGGRSLSAPAEALTREDTEFSVRILIEVDGRAAWHTITVRPNVLRGFDASLIVASEPLQDVFQHEQYALHRICDLVGHELRGNHIRLPRLVAVENRG